MRSIIEELWHGNIDPQNDRLINTPAMKQLMEYIARHHEDLLKTLTDEQKEIYRVTKVTYRTQQIGGIQHAFFPSLAFLWRIDGFPKFHGFCRGKQSARLSAVAQ